MSELDKQEKAVMEQMPGCLGFMIGASFAIFGLVFICLNGIVEFWDRCTQAGGIVLGFIIGVILGVLYYNLIEI